MLGDIKRRQSSTRASTGPVAPFSPLLNVQPLRAVAPVAVVQNSPTDSDNEQFLSSNLSPKAATAPPAMWDFEEINRLRRENSKLRGELNMRDYEEERLKRENSKLRQELYQLKDNLYSLSGYAANPGEAPEDGVHK
ncbi:HSP transcription factor [Striga asiatica]|uniref:HSP transcription factor n=1 Tax=Striga asiatica TaxID=4170 RepID=A0A5A7Q2K4_STRAF|nr:HSP transcription factor [Striga asiatica]